jgi:hypothetical protein
MYKCQWCAGRREPPKSRQEAIEFECHRWAHTGRWFSQEQALAVGQRKPLSVYAQRWPRYLAELARAK